MKSSKVQITYKNSSIVIDGEEEREDFKAMELYLESPLNVDVDIMPPSEVEKLFRAFAEKRKAELPRFTPDGIPITLENKFDDAIYNYLYEYWKTNSGEYDPKKDVIPESEMNKMHPKTKNEFQFEKWLLQQYDITKKEERGYTLEGNLDSLWEIFSAADMVLLVKALPNIGKNLAKLGKNVGDDVAEEAIEKTVKKEAAEEMAESTAKKEVTDTTEDLSQKHINKDDALEGSKTIERESSTAELNISSRNTSRGNPNAINHFDADLNTRQQNLLNQLPDYDSSVIVKKSDVSLSDLAALTAKTGDEFAMFTRGSQRLIIRGGPTNVNINSARAQELLKAGYKWSGHTHPGTDYNVKMPSVGDKAILDVFNQEQSVIYDSKGRFELFGGN